MKYYSLKNIKKHKAYYYVVFGERSNGKTFAALEEGLKEYVKTGKQTAYIRRWEKDITGKRAQTLYDGLINENKISKITNGEWTSIYYYARKWYLCKFEEDKRITSDTPIAYGFAISDQEHDKSTSYPNITTVIFDEFITRGMYLPDEFILFMNTLSTIIRNRKDVTVYMLGNTINKYCPYFQEMGLTHAKDMKEGAIDVYKYGKHDLTVVVERTKVNKEGKDSDVYFAFDNPKLEMITGGTWEIDIYPHCPYKFKPKEVLLKFYIIWENEIMQGNIVLTKERESFIFIHEKTTPIKEELNEIVFTPQADIRRNYITDILHPRSKIGERIREYFLKGKVFYSNNECGEVIRNYLQWCGKAHIIK